MIRRSFFGVVKPCVRYEKTDGFPMLQKVPEPSRITFFVEADFVRRDQLAFKTGDGVESGQKIQPVLGNLAYAEASLGGTVTSVFSHTGNFGKKYTGITITVDKGKTAAGSRFQEAGRDITIETAGNFLRCIPGGLPDGLFAFADKIHTIVIQGADEDVLGVTRAYTVKHEMAALKQGIDVLRKISGARQIVLTIPGAMASEGGTAGVEIKTLKPEYPAANPRLVARDCLGITVPAGSACEEAGICFISAEAVASLGKARDTGMVPSRKMITVIKKSGEKVMASAVIGTPVGDVLTACSEKVNENDRIVFGGPMTGSAVFSESHPVEADTDIVIVQDAGQIPGVADRSCINCGDCVRICPARVPVNMLIRYLGAGDYATAADQYDLLSCIECGLCAFACPANIPVFQYIKLGKYEFARHNAAEAEHA